MKMFVILTMMNLFVCIMGSNVLQAGTFSNPVVKIEGLQVHDCSQLTREVEIPVPSMESCNRDPDEHLKTPIKFMEFFRDDSSHRVSGKYCYKKVTEITCHAGIFGGETKLTREYYETIYNCDAIPTNSSEYNKVNNAMITTYEPKNDDYKCPIIWDKTTKIERYFVEDIFATLDPNRNSLHVPVAVQDHCTVREGRCRSLVGGIIEWKQEDLASIEECPYTPGKERSGVFIELQRIVGFHIMDEQDESAYTIPSSRATFMRCTLKEKTYRLFGTSEGGIIGWEDNGGPPIHGVPTEKQLSIPVKPDEEAPRLSYLWDKVEQLEASLLNEKLSRICEEKKSYMDIVLQNRGDIIYHPEIKGYGIPRVENGHIMISVCSKTSLRSLNFKENCPAVLEAKTLDNRTINLEEHGLYWTQKRIVTDCSRRKEVSFFQDASGRSLLHRKSSDLLEQITSGKIANQDWIEQLQGKLFTATEKGNKGPDFYAFSEDLIKYGNDKSNLIDKGSGVYEIDSDQIAKKTKGALGEVFDWVTSLPSVILNLCIYCMITILLLLIFYLILKFLIKICWTGFVPDKKQKSKNYNYKHV